MVPCICWTRTCLLGVLVTQIKALLQQQILKSTCNFHDVYWAVQALSPALSLGAASVFSCKGLAELVTVNKDQTLGISTYLNYLSYTLALSAWQLGSSEAPSDAYRRRKREDESEVRVHFKTSTSETQASVAQLVAGASHMTQGTA